MKDCKKQKDAKKEAEVKKKEEKPAAFSNQDLQKVTGGGFADNIPRVPENPIDDEVKGKF